MKVNEQYKLVGREVGNLRQENDFYPTPHYVTKALLDNYSFSPVIWECACGDGRMSEVLEQAGYHVISTDLFDRGYKYSVSGIDFLKDTHKVDNIVANPPFELAYEFIVKGLELSNECLALLLPIRYLTGKKRHSLYKINPPTKIIVIPNKVDFLGNGNPVMEFAWFVWDKRKVGESKIAWADCKPKNDNIKMASAGNMGKAV